MTQTPALPAGLGWPQSPPRTGAHGLGWPAADRLVPHETPAAEARRDPGLGDFGPWPAPGTRDYALIDHAPAAPASPPAAAATQLPADPPAPARPASPACWPKPATTRVIVVANQKGGVGKTTTCVNIAAALAQHGARVLLLDLDPQGNSSTALRIDHGEAAAGIYDALVDDVPLAKLISPCPDIQGLYAVPASIDLAGAEIELVPLLGRESRLCRALESHLQETADSTDSLDYVFIDCPPSLGLLTINALVAAQEMLIPIQCEYYALEGVNQLLRNVELIKAHLNARLRVSTVVLTMYDGRTRLSAGVAQEVRTHFGDRVLRTAIPRSVRISEAPSYAQSVMTYDPGSPGALSYEEAAHEIALSVDSAFNQSATTQEAT